MNSYYPDRLPSIDEEALQEARANGWRPLLIRYDEPNVAGDLSYIYADFVPREGEHIVLKDGGLFVVERVTHLVMGPAAATCSVRSHCTFLFPLIVARRVTTKDDGPAIAD